MSTETGTSATLVIDYRLDEALTVWLLFAFVKLAFGMTDLKVGVYHAPNTTG